MKVQKLLSPVTSLKGAVEVIRAGADEIYCGVKIPGAMHVLNRSTPCYVPTYDELGRIARYARSRGVETVVTLGLPFVSQFMVRQMKEHILSCVRQGVDALIAGDIGLVRMIRDDMGLDIAIYASTLLGAMNYEAVDFIRKLGVQRVVIDRHVSIEEVGEIVQASKDVEIEVFVHGPGCSNINANCRLELIGVSRADMKKVRSVSKGLKGLLNPCTWVFDIYELGKGERSIARAPILDAFTFCSLCRVPELIDTGVTGLKIVGRCYPIAYQARVTEMYRGLLDLIERRKSGEVSQIEREQFDEMLNSFEKGTVQPAFRNRDGSVRLHRDMWCKEGRCYYSPFFQTPRKFSSHRSYSYNSSRGSK